MAQAAVESILNVLVSPFVYYVDRKHRRGEEALLYWVKHVDAPILGNELRKALEPLLKDTSEHVDKIFHTYAVHDNGQVFWTEDSFRRHLEPHPLLREHVDLLWRIFYYAARYPFGSSRRLDTIESAHIHLASFRGAFALLVLHGWDLIGNTGNEMTRIHRDRVSERTAQDKAPRMARIIHTCLLHPQKDESFISPYDDIKDVLYFVQPPIFQNMCMKPKDFSPYFHSAASTLPQVDIETRASPPSLSRASLEAVLQMLLLLRPGHERWREGFSRRYKIGKTPIVTQLAGDVHAFTLAGDETEIAAASTYATALMDFTFPKNESIIPQEAFESWCVEQPFFIHSFFALWSAIFAPPKPTPPPPPPLLPTTTANLLSFLPAAHFLSDSPKYRWHSNELQLQLDLHNSALINPKSCNNLKSHPEILQLLSTPQDYYHILTLETEDKALFAAFTSPRAEPPARMQMCGEGLRTEYIWGTSLVRLRPSLEVWRCGGLGTEGGLGRLVSEGTNERGEGVELALDLDGREVCITVPGGGEMQRLKLRDVRCYRLPGRAAHVGPTISGSGIVPLVLPWSERDGNPETSNEDLHALEKRG